MPPLEPLEARIQNRDMPLEEILTAWARDVRERNGLASDRNELADWYRNRMVTPR